MGASVGKAFLVIAGLLAVNTTLWARHEFVVDSTFYYRTEEQSTVETEFDFNDPETLGVFPYQFGAWRGQDSRNIAQPVVKPDFMFERYYRAPTGEIIWFQLIRGRIERAVHVPAICYFNGGWQILKQDHLAVISGDNKIPCAKMIGKAGDNYATELYFYLWEDPKRDFMKGCSMFRVSITNKTNDDEKKTDILKTFVRDIFMISAGE